MYNPNLHFHFIGIGGSGMSGIAEILITLGFKVSGSDLKFSAICSRLRRLGADVYEGHAAENLPQSCSLVVYSSAVPVNNPEIEEAQRRGLPVVRRAEVLAELMRLKYGIVIAGSHGKTTTTSLIAHVLEQGGLDPTAIIGGIVGASESGGRFGRGDYLVAESDESDKSFLLLRPTIAVVTNIDAEHIEAYGSLAELEGSFAAFVSSVPFYGVAVLCADDARVKSLAEGYRGRKVTYGLAPEADISAGNLQHDKYSMSFDLHVPSKERRRVTLSVPGSHAVLNSLAAVAVGLELGVPLDVVVTALSSFAGVKRRLEKVGESSGVTVISDYGHHPTEITATLRAIRAGWKGAVSRLHVVFQPHRYTRTRDCFSAFLEAFHECDTLIICDIYAAGEPEIKGISAEALCAKMSKPKALHVHSPSDAISVLAPLLKPGDIILCLGAGSIGALPEAFVAALQAGGSASPMLHEAQLA